MLLKYRKRFVLYHAPALAVGHMKCNELVHRCHSGYIDVAESLYDYHEVLHKSGLFYLAQKSGKLPKMFPIPWRGDSALKDGCAASHELHGGLYNGTFD